MVRLPLLLAPSIYFHVGKAEKFVITLLVMRHFSALPGASRACADFRDSTGLSRFKQKGLSIGLYIRTKLSVLGGGNR